MTDGETPLDEELNALFTDVRRFLMQEQDLFGETLYPESQRRDAATTPQVPAPKITAEETQLFSDTPYPQEAWTSAETIESLDKQICNCMKCPLGTTRTKFVFGVGNPKAHVVVVGEAPGADEDAKGEPFVGRAGQLLNKILEAIQFKREEVYICNILKCRPPNNRDPLPEEVEQCEPYLWKQLELIRPESYIADGD